ncbi:unnamed protein product [Linum trigynum]|uniref:Uncharacterized protein n=1 Tax=Linum trigynum TaxID=586398 RepID=A0AAV2DU02_9ROSI
MSLLRQLSICHQSLHNNLEFVHRNLEFFDLGLVHRPDRLQHPCRKFLATFGAIAVGQASSSSLCPVAAVVAAAFSRAASFVAFSAAFCDLKPKMRVLSISRDLGKRGKSPR